MTKHATKHPETPIPSDLTPALSLYVSAVESAIRMQTQMNACMMGLMAQNLKLMRCPFEQQREDDGRGKANPCAAGPDLMDHYGRRHHDVDVERAL